MSAEEILHYLLTRPAFWPVGTKVTRRLPYRSWVVGTVWIHGVVLAVHEQRYYSYTSFTHTVQWEGGRIDYGYLTCGLEQRPDGETGLV